MHTTLTQADTIAVAARATALAARGTALIANEAQAIAREAAAAEQMHRAESALHIARQTGIDPWINAAAHRLHTAIDLHAEALAQLNGDHF